MKNLFIILLTLIITFGCNTSRRTSHSKMMEKAPEWVNQVPVNPSYYHGVGSSLKGINIDHRERARQNALAEIASGISVNIAATSVLNQFEIDRAYSEFFRDNIRVSTQKYLEGYELVEVFETDQQYWVYYRLSKFRYDQVKQEKMRTAMGTSRSKFDQARALNQQGRAIDAFGFYVKSFEDIRDFLGEDLKTEIDGQSISFPTLIMSDFLNLVHELHFDFQTDSYPIKPGIDAIGASIEVIVRDKQGRPVAGVPVFTRFSWLPGNRSDAVTDARGAFRVPVSRITTGRRSETISCQVDLRRIANTHTGDMVIQRFISSINPDTWVLPIKVIPPQFFISIESNQGSAFASQVFNEFVRLLSIDGIDIAREENTADYRLLITIDISNPTQVGTRFTSVIQTSFQVNDNVGRGLFNQRPSDISGVGNLASTAIEDAQHSLLGKIRITYYPNIITNLFPGN